MQLQGDALPVQLYIGAATLTALSVSMTQAGPIKRRAAETRRLLSAASYDTICVPSCYDFQIAYAPPEICLGKAIE
jgi:hypothetical protein